MAEPSTPPASPDPASARADSGGASSHNCPSIVGYVFCAAQDVRRLSLLVSTPGDADAALRAMANLEQIAGATGSPAEDLREIEIWRKEAARRVEELRTPHPKVEVNPTIIERRRPHADRTS